jgi:protocatechuate 3,4-dioxygenase beta subunit
MKTAITVSAPSSPALSVAQPGQRLASGAYSFSLSGDAWAQRLITQMYFEGDPLIKQCPIVKTINNDDAVRTLIAELDTHAAVPLDCLAYRFDLVLRGHRATLFENRTQGAAR